MMNQPLRRVDPLGRSAAPTEARPTAPRAQEPMTGSVWPICGGSVRAIVDNERARSGADPLQALPPLARVTPPARGGLRPAASRKREPTLSNSKDILALHAHTMRQAPTDSEARLGRTPSGIAKRVALRSSQLGVAFRRPVPLLGFIADLAVTSSTSIANSGKG